MTLKDYIRSWQNVDTTYFIYNMINGFNSEYTIIIYGSNEYSVMINKVSYDRQKNGYHPVNKFTALKLIKLL